jgi:predicted Rossmann fold flavoprotein
MKTDDWDVVVVGGGASGMFAAITAAKHGKRVLILDKNKSVGQKLAITGGGRCNITNAEYDTRALLEHYGDGAEFLYSPFAQFGVKDTFDYFESRGLPLVVQARKRAFPHTERAPDVVAVLKKDLTKHNVTIKSGTAVKRIIVEADKVTGVETASGIIRGRSYIIATGGASHPETGSTGDGFKFLRSVGHTVKDPTPTIVPIAVAEDWIKDMPGTSITPAKITFFLDSKKQFSKTGKVLCTHFGLSGPLILNSAGKVGELLLTAGNVTATIDADPEHDLGSAEKRAIKLFDTNKNKSLRTVFKDLCPPGAAKGIMTLLTDIDFDTKVHSVSKEDRKKIVHLIKALPVTITSLMGFDRAVVADGGVVLSEIDTRTMRSKLINNLFVTGDLLHINRPSGGYSLQLCWTTGFVAGNAA